MKNDQDQDEALGLLQASVTRLEGKLQSAREAFQQVQDSAMLPVQKAAANLDPKLWTHFIKSPLPDSNPYNRFRLRNVAPQR